MNRQQYQQAYHDIRDERRNWHDHGMDEVFSHGEVIEFRLTEAAFANIQPALISLHNSGLGDDLGWREFNKLQAEACGWRYCWAAERREEMRKADRAEAEAFDFCTPPF